MIFGIVQHLRSARPGARPGDGTIRSLLDGELFINTADNVRCQISANGVMQTEFLNNAAGMAALLASLPTTQPATPGLPWLDNGHPALS